MIRKRNGERMPLEGDEKLDVVGEYDFAVDENEGVAIWGAENMGRRMKTKLSSALVRSE
jgi:hypothetical protein